MKKEYKKGENQTQNVSSFVKIFISFSFILFVLLFLEKYVNRWANEEMGDSKTSSLTGEDSNLMARRGAETSNLIRLKNLCTEFWRNLPISLINICIYFLHICLTYLFYNYFVVQYNTAFDDVGQIYI